MKIVIHEVHGEMQLIVKNPFVPNMLQDQLPSSSTKFEFSMYSTSNLKSSLVKAEHFLQIDGTLEGLRVKVTTMHLDDEATQWYHSLTQNWASPTPIT